MAEESGRTWDGLPIASDHPTGSTVVVRRPGPAGDSEVLVLHRQARGVDFEGDWAWTAPAGCRQPGEAVYPAALRELAEEAGIDGVAPWAVDLSQRWAVFAVDVPADRPVRLVDPEHDRFEWLSRAAAGDRVRPDLVATQLVRAATVPRVALDFRPMRADDLDLLGGWLQAPHVRRWWDAGVDDPEEVRRRYAPRVAGDDPVTAWIIDIDGRAAGFAQAYRLADVDDDARHDPATGAVGFDYAIGDELRLGSGLGTRMVWELCRDVLDPRFPDAPLFVAQPSEQNGASLRVLEKCAFMRGERVESATDPAETEIVCRLDVGHWLGRPAPVTPGPTESRRIGASTEG